METCKIRTASLGSAQKLSTTFKQQKTRGTISVTSAILLTAFAECDGSDGCVCAAHFVAAERQHQEQEACKVSAQPTQTAERNPKPASIAKPPARQPTAFGDVQRSKVHRPIKVALQEQDRSGEPGW